MTLTLHNLSGSSKKRPKKRLGRGNASGKGTYCARGLKGQRSRAGGKGGLRRRSLMRQLIKKTPKLGGFKSKKVPAQTITLALLEKYFSDGDLVTRRALIQKKLISKTRTALRIKIVGNTRLTKKLTIIHFRTSKQAESQITNAGGTVQKSTSRT